MVWYMNNMKPMLYNLMYLMCCINVSVNYKALLYFFIILTIANKKEHQLCKVFSFLMYINEYFHIERDSISSFIFRENVTQYNNISYYNNTSN